MLRRLKIRKRESAGDEPLPGLPVTELEELKQRIRSLEESVSEREQQRRPAGVLPHFDYNRFVAAIGPSPQLVAQIYARYVPWFKGCKRVVDLGTGRGIFLGVLRNAGIGSYGVDTDPTHVQSCRQAGYEAVTGGVLEHLDSLAPGAVDGIFMGHVIEHLPHDAKLSLVKLAFEKLAPEGVMAVETPNTTSQFVMQHVYYLDPTHQPPLHPRAYRFIFEDAGFKVMVSEFHLLHPGQNPKDQAASMNYSLILRRP